MQGCGPRATLNMIFSITYYLELHNIMIVCCTYHQIGYLDIMEH